MTKLTYNSSNPIIKIVIQQSTEVSDATKQLIINNSLKKAGIVTSKAIFGFVAILSTFTGLISGVGSELTGVTSITGQKEISSAPYLKPMTVPLNGLIGILQYNLVTVFYSFFASLGVTGLLYFTSLVKRKLIEEIANQNVYQMSDNEKYEVLNQVKFLITNKANLLTDSEIISLTALKLSLEIN
jgi:hypothetical protein